MHCRGGFSTRPSKNPASMDGFFAITMRNAQFSSYRGAIIGIVIAILILITRLHDLILAIVVLLLGAFIGNYVQYNKDLVKSKLKSFIDRM